MFALDQNHNMGLIATGITLGLVHVLAGPDHLSALAALSAGTSWRSFMLGIRWGIGHSGGHAVVALLFIILKGNLDLHIIGRYCNSLVGLFMILLGYYSAVGAWKIYREKRSKQDPDLESAKSLTVKNNVFTTQGTSATVTTLQNDAAIESTECDGVANNSDVEAITSMKTLNHHDHEAESLLIEQCCSIIPFVDLHEPITQRIVSFSIGLLHGVAGPGGVLGVLPAVEMQNWQSAFLYLGSFLLSSTMCMGFFAAFYGESTRRIGATAKSLQLGISIFSAGLSILVGIAWLTLSVTGQLESLFH